MKQIFLSFQFIMLSALMNAYSDDNIFLTVQNDLKKDSVASLNNVKESYKLSGKNLTALAEKILYKKTPQEDMYLYLLRPDENRNKVLPAIVYFTGGGWVNGNVEGQIPNAAWFRDHGIIGIDADYRVKSRQFPAYPAKDDRFPQGT